MSIAEELTNLGLISGKNAQKTTLVFEQLYPDILEFDIGQSSIFMSQLWSRWKNYPMQSNSLSGAVFETLIATLLYRHKIVPLYIQATLSFVPNVYFDFVAYTREYGPIILSAKTSLRERYKQADLEGMMLRQVHRKAKSFLITMNASEAKSVNAKIENGQVLGLDKVVVASEHGFDILIKELLELSYYKPEKIDIITSSRLIRAN